MNKHSLKNMIYNLENKKGLEYVEFTEKAVVEILGYLKELDKQLDEPKTEECEKDHEIVVLKKALEKAMENIKVVTGNKHSGNSDFYIELAKKELGVRNDK